MSRRLLKDEAYRCFVYLMDHTNFDESSKGYGLTLDRHSNKNMASISASGFMLTALVIGSERGWMNKEDAKKRALLTIKNFYLNIPHYEGLLIHFANFKDGTRYKACEYSTADTMLFVNGMLTADAYFNDVEIHDYSMKLFNRINFPSFTKIYNDKLVFKMAYNDIKDGDYRHGNSDGWIYQWHMYAEQLCLYFQAAASDLISKEDAKKLYYGFERNIATYHNYSYVFTPGGTLFTYQYSHAWLDFMHLDDETGFNWFKNSQQAIKAAQHFCSNDKNFKTFNSYSWGVSACDGPHGYRGYGLPPYGDGKTKSEEIHYDGTVALYAIISSLPFNPSIVSTSLDTLESKHPALYQDYGFVDSFNFEDGEWIDDDYISIDKGISLIMIDNYFYKTTWKFYNQHPLILKAIDKLDFKWKKW
jgi:hypothetical protein